MIAVAETTKRALNYEDVHALIRRHVRPVLRLIETMEGRELDLWTIGPETETKMEENAEDVARAAARALAALLDEEPLVGDRVAEDSWADAVSLMTVVATTTGALANMAPGDLGIDHREIHNAAIGLSSNIVGPWFERTAIEPYRRAPRSADADVDAELALQTA